MEQEGQNKHSNVKREPDGSRDGVGPPAISARAWRLRGPVRRSWSPRRPVVEVALAEVS